MAVINGVDVEKVKQTQADAKRDASTAERQPKLIAHWLGASKARVEFGDINVQIGGEGEMRAMQVLLASLAACDVDVVAMNAALMGLTIDKLWIEVTGHFNTQSFYGIENAAGPGYDSISYIVHIKAPKATPGQMKLLKEKCQKTSPVGDSLAKSIPLTFDIKAE